jgi:cobalt-precorrin-5B (C1)-methyltransferase
MDLKPIPKGPLRWGYSTGACATACTRAALLALITQSRVSESVIRLPGGQIVPFNIHSCEFSAASARCATYKDAGDDPDVTHGAEIASTVTLDTHNEVRFLPGEGVGMVTLPGLAISVGQPAINPVPRRMMQETATEVLTHHGLNKGVNISISVTNGEVIAKKTLNSRLGIIGGISILGTTGLVKPFSASAYIASIEQGIDVAIANGATEVMINSGGRSEKIVQQWAPHLPAWCFIQYGNWIGETLAKIKSASFRAAEPSASPPLHSFTIGMMLGKAVKLAAGHFNTHSNESSWDKDFVTALALKAGYSDIQGSAIRQLNRAGRLTELFPFRKGEPFYQALAAQCRKVIRQEVNELPFTIVLIDAADQSLVFENDQS